MSDVKVYAERECIKIPATEFPKRLKDFGSTFQIRLQFNDPRDSTAVDELFTVKSTRTRKPDGSWCFSTCHKGLALYLPCDAGFWLKRLSSGEGDIVQSTTLDGIDYTFMMWVSPICVQRLHPNDALAFHMRE